MRINKENKKSRVAFPANIVFETDKYRSYKDGDNRLELSFDKIQELITSKNVKIEFINSWLNYEQKPTILITHEDK